METVVSAITRGSYIRYYTAVWYDTAALKEHRSRTRRDASSSYPGDATLNLRLHALDRLVKKHSFAPPRFRFTREKEIEAVTRSTVGRGGGGGRERELYRRKIPVSRGCQRRNNLWMSGHFNGGGAGSRGFINFHFGSTDKHWP